MDIGSYKFEDFCALAEKFHGYAAPGVLVGAYLVQKAKSALPAGVLFEAVAESVKCLPDAVQLLTPCTIGNQRLKIRDLGRFAVCLYDKYSGEGFRSSLDLKAMENWPELYGWYCKKKAKQDQDSTRLLEEIRAAGDTICRLEPIIIHKSFLGRKHKSGVKVCPACGEAYPASDGAICLGCQGQAPYEKAG